MTIRVVSDDEMTGLLPIPYAKLTSASGRGHFFFGTPTPSIWQSVVFSFFSPSVPKLTRAVTLGTDLDNCFSFRKSADTGKQNENSLHRSNYGFGWLLDDVSIGCNVGFWASSRLCLRCSVRGGPLGNSNFCPERCRSGRFHAHAQFGFGGRSVSPKPLLEHRSVCGRHHDDRVGRNAGKYRRYVDGFKRLWTCLGDRF